MDFIWPRQEALRHSIKTERDALELLKNDAPRGDGGEASYLTDAKGMALYTFKKDTPVKSACAGDCVPEWPPYTRRRSE
jgi:predicted lipoprotein with Yx(FWY)xxD motif